MFSLICSVQSSVLPMAPLAINCVGNEHAEGVPGEVAVLIECTGTNADLDKQRVDAFTEEIVEIGLAEDAVLSLNSEQEKVTDISPSMKLSIVFTNYIYSVIILYCTMLI